LNTFLLDPTNNKIAYHSQLHDNGPGADTIEVKVNDNGNTGTGTGNDVPLGAITINIAATNDRPEDATLPSTLDVIEDELGGSPLDLSSIIVSDVDSDEFDPLDPTNPHHLTITLTSGAGVKASKLSATSDGSVIVGGADNVLTLTGTQAELNAFLSDPINNKIAYHSELHDNGVDTIEVEISDNGNTGSGGVLTRNFVDPIILNIAATNDDPINANQANFPDVITVTEDSDSPVDLSSINIVDVDADEVDPLDLTNPKHLTVTLTSGVTPAAKDSRLKATSGDGVTVGGNDTKVLTLTGTLFDLNAFLDDPARIQYRSVLHDNGIGADAIQVKVNDNGNTGADGGSDQVFGTISVNIDATNTPPENRGIVQVDDITITVTEDVASDVDLSAIDLFDVDAEDDAPGNPGKLTMTLSSGAGSKLEATSTSLVTVGGNGTNILTLRGTQGDLNLFLDDQTNVQFTGALNVSGINVDSIQVVVNDHGNIGSGGAEIINFGTAVVDIDGVIPELRPDVFGDENSPTTNEDTSLRIDESELLANDFDPSVGRPTPGSQWIHSVGATSGLGATVTYDPATGKITYDPSTSDRLQALTPYDPSAPLINENVIEDTFTYAVTDDPNELNPPVSTVTLYVSGLNDAPAVGDDFATESTTSAAVVIRPLDNDSDIDGTLNLDTFVITQEPRFGSIARRIILEGTEEVLELAYSPFASFTGSDSFRYTISDNLGQSSRQATVVIEPSLVPETVSDVGTGLQGDEVIIDVLTNDSVVPGQGTLDFSTLTIFSDPSNGQADRLLDGTVKYTPDANFIGTDSFQYTIADTSGNVSHPTSVSVTIDLRTPPTTAADVGAGLQGDSINIAVLSNDVAVQGQLDPTKVAVVSGPSNGQTISQVDGTITYTPNAGFTGTDVFEYTIGDTVGNVSAATTVTVTVDPRVPPTTVPDIAGGVSGDNIIIDVLSNDMAVNGQLDLSTLTIVSGPSNGQADPQPDGTIIYDPNTGFFGTDIFEYTISDTFGSVSNPTTVTVHAVRSGLQNPLIAADVNASGDVSVLDALVIINRLSDSGGSSIPVGFDDRGPNFYDVDGGLSITALDALIVINRLSGSLSAFEGELADQPIIVDMVTTVNKSTESTPVDEVYDAAGEVMSDEEDLVAIGADDSDLDLLAGDRESDDEGESEESPAELNDFALLDLLDG
jgi:hypothetical protein